MIYALSKAVGAALTARNFPVAVVYGPERLNRQGFEPMIVIERDRTSGDAYQPVQGAKRNPRHKAVQMVGARATVWAKSSLAGARVAEHESLCEQFVDALYCAISEYMHEVARIPNFTVSEAKYLGAAELVALGLAADAAAAEAWPGVVYSLRWRMPRGVILTDYAGDALPEGSASGITGLVEVRRNADDPPEIVEMP